MPQYVFGIFTSAREATVAKNSLREAGFPNRRILEQLTAVMVAENTFGEVGQDDLCGLRFAKAMKDGQSLVAVKADRDQDAATAKFVMERSGALEVESRTKERPAFQRSSLSKNGVLESISATQSPSERPQPEQHPKRRPDKANGYSAAVSGSPGKQSWFGHILDLARKTYSVFSEQRGASRGAAIAFYTVTSIAPILVIVIAVAGFVFGSEAASGALFEQFRGLVGAEGADVLQKAIASAASPSGGIVAGVVSIITLILSASGVFVELEDALNAIWQAKAQEGVWNMGRARIASLGLVIGLGFLLIVSLVIDAGLKAFSSVLPFGAIVLMIVSIAVSVGLMTVLIAAMFKFLPATPIAWRDVWRGALVTAVLFEVGKFLIGLYLGRSSTASSLGAAGALLALLFWVYYTAQIFLFGAAFTKVSAEKQPAAAGEQTRAQATLPVTYPSAKPNPRRVPSLSAITAFVLVEALVQLTSKSRRAYQAENPK